VRTFYSFNHYGILSYNTQRPNFREDDLFTNFTTLPYCPVFDANLKEIIKFDLKTRLLRLDGKNLSNFLTQTQA
jgi:hypothetical protein